MSTGKLRESFVHESVHIHLEDTSLLSRPKEEGDAEIEYTVHLEACGSATFKNGDVQNSATLDAHKKLCGGSRRAYFEVGDNNIYTTWFGVYTSDRAATVKKTYRNITDDIFNKECIYYNNGPLCRSNIYAYTYMTGTTVYLCSVFYEEPTYCSKTGESKEGILLHEWSHPYGQRDDVDYGRSNCKDLAKNEPDDAVRNADSYQYYYCDLQ
ncbi:PREDICTED: peptidyl-Lys metalloendopeptidase-like [Amphimedon queenslandica]|uniref:Lysine-specific metallo-endopeptidase domain-containing protein n=1 Tax=Amphimedon queenslandica TaxID=400682 RepID=A0A1X7UK90_AMPQE|nr:PREDICTED: peptidyl-Lys metalloendopeptidase-like [Amphimedon queenslandica]|eukprot:XP_019853813.1 PREDICTED: peptidyl-Lys metalloendopeptidase-like [Amphimedon queenslandica]